MGALVALEAGVWCEFLSKIMLQRSAGSGE